ncbi:MAG TPA: hypothetical protein VK933_15425 [Longimicrobiales bacterium]|nr:hypothetical protein [Longimicrobiales bacterium]
MKRMMSIGLLAFTAAACDSDSTGPDTQGSYDLEVTGAFTETAEGPAWFGSDVNEDGDPVFMLLFGDEMSRHVVLAGREGASRPDVGAYAIEEGSWELLHVISDDDELLGMFYATEGEITITSSSSSRIRGSIEFVATELLGEAEVTGSITFDAVLAPAALMQTTVSAARSMH